MSGSILVLNSGSSTLKFALFGQAGEGLVALSRESRECSAGTRSEDIAELVRSAAKGGELAAVGHRVAHGGEKFAAPVRVTPQVIEQLERLAPLAPLHQPANVASMRAIAQRYPELPQVACFDTAFHRGRLEVEQAYALPRSITERGVRRYGFHGLSYESIAEALRRVDPAAAAGRVIVAHLGSGASLCAMRNGRSVATTMGFTALGGIPMGTRSGDLDPGVVLYLMNHLGMSSMAIERMLYRESGLLGASGVSNDMRALLASEDPHAAFAIDLFVHRVGREIGSLAAALGGLDALVFTAGIGERSAVVRERICRHAGWLGVRLDPLANQVGASRIGAATSRVVVFAIPTDEEQVIARHTARTTLPPRPR